MLLDLNNVTLSIIFACQRISETNCVLNAFVWVTRCEQIIISISETDNKLINDVFDLGAICADDTDKNHTVPNKLLNQSINARLISIPAVQHDFLWM